MDEVALLQEQVTYYRERAREYDGWWLREGRYDRGSEANGRWFGEIAALEDALERISLTGDVLELACGTGLWTRRLVRHARRLTAVDAAEEMLEVNRERVGNAEVEYVQADLFSWTPPVGAYDVCFFGFWLSRVPESRFPAFGRRCGPRFVRAAACSSSTAGGAIARPRTTTSSPTRTSRR